MIGRVSGRPVQIDHQPAQKGDMRDTYADTTPGARGSGICALGRPRTGLARDVRLDGSDSAMMQTFGVVVRARRRGCDRLGGCAGEAVRRCPPAPPQADKFLFKRGQEEFKEQTLAPARGVLPPDRRQLPAEPVPARREARRRRHLHRRGHDRVAAPGRQRVPRVPDLLPDQRARRLRAVPARLRLSRSRCSRPIAIRRATRDVVKELQVFLDRYPNSALMPDARKLMRDAKDRLSEVELSHRLHLLPHQVVSGRDRSLPGSPRRTIRNTRTATPSTSIWRSRCLEPIDSGHRPKASGSAPLLRAAAQGVRTERVPRERQEAHRRDQDRRQ